MSIFADQVSMPTFGMTQHSGDWRSKARANIAARENAMLQQMAAATDPRTQIDTGKAQLSIFFNPKKSFPYISYFNSPKRRAAETIYSRL